MNQKLKNKKYLTKSDGGLMLIPLPFKMKKFKETDLKRHRRSLNKKEEKENIPKDNNSQKVKSMREKEKSISNIPPEIKTKTVIFRTRKENKENINQKINKKFIEIPIISHKSEKPSFVSEEITSGKIYPSYHSFTAKIENNKTKKKFEDIPVVAHESELPIMAVEEIDSWKICPTVLTMTRVTETDFKTSNIPQLKEYKYKSVDKKINTKINKKYKDIPIVAHNSEKPSYITEEVNSGKFSSSIPIINDNNNNIYKIKTKNKNKNKKYVEIPIVEHYSEIPNVVFEEIGLGKLNLNVSTSITTYKAFKTSQSIQVTNNFKCKKYFDIPIVAHDSEKPSIAFEEINFGKLNSNFQTSFTTYKDLDLEKNKPVSNKVLFGKNKCKNKNKKYVEIPVAAHESEKPKVVFEEINVGKLYSGLKTF